MKQNSGLTLIELIITISIFIIASLGILGLFSYSFKTVGNSKAILTATGLAAKQIEIIRNMPYDKLGTTEGWPPGDIPSSQIINQNKINYTIQTIIEYVDDPYDSLFPDDTTGNDYKKAEVMVSWDKFFSINPVKLTTNVCAKGLEIPNGAGGLKINLFDNNGNPVSQASVKIENLALDPNIKINRETNNAGILQILDLPPSGENYHIIVSKEGYSQDYTIAPDSLGASTPLQPDLRVIEKELTEKTFSIDKISSLKISTLTKYCSSVPNISFNMRGQKLIGRDPDVFKYYQNLSTNSSGELIIDNLEFDTYNIALNSLAYDLAGANPLIPLILLPNTNQNFYFILKPHQAHTLLATVKDNSTGLVLSGAEVKLSKIGYEETLITGKGIWRQTDWQGGSGQENWEEEDMYFDDDGNINTNNSEEMKLAGGHTQQNFNETFDDAAYENFSATTADWNTTLKELRLPKIGTDFSSSATGESLKINSAAYTITKAYLNASHTLNGETINYYLSANGGIDWENVISGVEYIFINQGNDLRWKAELSTNTVSITPSIQSISINYTDSNPFANNGFLISSSYDTGTNKTIWGNLSWEPQNQAIELGESPIKFQIAANNDKATWNFKGPDGTEETFYTSPDASINPIHNNHQYIRYKILLSTENSSFSPIVSDITIDFTSGCSTPGQVFFSPLEETAYDLDISLAGYQGYFESINVSGNNSTKIFLNPNP
ncbi:MAG: Uncharacterized protein Athens101410_44 [Parcubacteria group bacterium Athens1014_10]|nr:MAG: Uncharacterized protein Athens101410_44 [Parcubacteria group bacterium Athens1014_10]TSD06070.1 MAG: Uncharacterized protein Athens071412_44 [Parcubacteria group bacterium Athens0714_12]